MNLRPLASILAPLLLSGIAASQSTWYVDVNAGPSGTGAQNDPFDSIQEGLDVAVDGDTILVGPGVYLENLDYLVKRVVVESTHGAHSTIIQPTDQTEPTVQNGQNNAAFLRGFMVRGNNQSPGIESTYNRGMTVERCIIRGNVQGLLNLWDMNVRNCNVVSNTQGLGHFGGGHGADSITYIDNSIFWDNGVNFFGQCLDCETCLFCLEYVVFGDPLFFGTGDHHLLPGSPCINTGDPDRTDPDGSRLDIGVHPYDANWPLGESYCTPTGNSSGGRAVILISGSASLSANDLSFSCVRTPANASGLFFYGTERGLLPLGDGFVCLGGSIARLPVTPTGPFGVPDFDLDVTDLPGHVPTILPGESRYFQYWFRDVAGAGGGFNYSNGVCVTFAP